MAKQGRLICIQIPNYDKRFYDKGLGQKIDKKDKLEHLAENKLEQHHWQASTTWDFVSGLARTTQIDFLT